MLGAPAAVAEEENWVGRSYQSVLAHFGEGQRDLALQQLQDIEVRQIDAGAGEELFAIERQIVAEVADHDSQALAALMLLHHDAFLRYRAARRLLVASHALRMVVEIGAAGDMRSAPAAVKNVASLAMTSLAGVVVQLNQADAVELLRRATELAPANGHALLALGALQEKLGRYPEALAALQRCVAVAPSGEARLRLAVNQRRTGAAAEAEAVLAALLRDPAEDWVDVLASQEVAGLLADLGRHGDAVKRLRAAVARHPDDPTLRIQLAAMLDRSGDPAGAQAVAREAAERAAAASAASEEADLNPRVIYNRWPKHAFDDAATEMRRAAEPELPRLAMALGTPRGRRG